MSRKLRMGMIGGGRGAFIGAVHRIAALMDGEIELVCGALSSNPERPCSRGRTGTCRRKGHTRATTRCSKRKNSSLKT